MIVSSHQEPEGIDRSMEAEDKPTPGPRFSSRRRGKFVLLLFPTCAVLAVVEVVLRLFGYGVDHGPCFQGFDGAGIVLMCYDKNPDGYLDVDLTKHSVRQQFYRDYGIIDMESYYHYTPYGVVTPCDEHGMRPGQIRPKTPGRIRIVAIGDSFTYGHALKPSDPWPAQLDALLNEGGPEGRRRFEVLNWGIGNTDIPQIAALLFNRVLPDSRDEVVYAWYLNDPISSKAYIDAYRDLLGGMRKTARHLPDRYVSIGWKEVHGMRRWSAMYDLLLEKWSSREMGERTLAFTNDAYGAVNADGWGQTQRLIAQMGQACREKRTSLHVAIWPMLVGLGEGYPFVPAHRSVIEACRKAEVPVIDLRDRLKAFPADRLIIHREDRHPNKLACQLAAEAIRDHLREAHAAWFK